MNIIKIKKQKVATFVAFIALLILPELAGAVPFTSDLSITGSVDFDESSAVTSSNVTLQTGDFSATEGTASNTSTFIGTTVTGADPLLGTLTDLGDGFGMTADITANGPADSNLNFDPDFALAFDLGINAFNNSLIDTYRVTFGIDFLNGLNTTGGDAFADSELSLSLDLTEIFFSDLLSDSNFGNEVAAVFTGDFGGLLSESGSTSFDVTLAPGASAAISGFWTLNGGVFSDPGTATVDFSTFVSITNVENLTPTTPVPEPGSFILLGSGLIGLFISRRNLKDKA